MLSSNVLGSKIVQDVSTLTNFRHSIKMRNIHTMSVSVVCLAVPSYILITSGMDILINYE